MSLPSFSHSNPAHHALFAARQADEHVLAARFAEELIAAGITPDVAPTWAEAESGIHPFSSCLRQGDPTVLLHLAEQFIQAQSAFAKAERLDALLQAMHVRPRIFDRMRPVRKIKNLQAPSAHLWAWLGQHSLFRRGQAYPPAQSIDDVLEHTNPDQRHAFLMLERPAQSLEEAHSLQENLMRAIERLGRNMQDMGPWSGPNLVIKVSSLHPTFDRPHWRIIALELYPALLALAAQAKRYDIGLTLDAESSEHDAIVLLLLEKLARDPALRDWEGLGVTVAARQKQAVELVAHLGRLAHETHRKIMVRLIRGYTLPLGMLSPSPFFHEAKHVNLAYLRCAQQLITSAHWLYPQFTIYSAAMANTLASQHHGEEMEFHCLPGEHIRSEINKYAGIDWRVIMPCGDATRLALWDLAQLRERHQAASIKIAQRHNAFDWGDEPAIAKLENAINEAQKHLLPSQAGHSDAARAVLNPANPVEVMGYVPDSALAEVDLILEQALAGQVVWARTRPTERTRILEKAADLIEARAGEFVFLQAREAGKTMRDGLTQWRDAIKICRQMTMVCAQLPPPSGQPSCLLSLCIWQAPLSILTGQIVAALLTGHSVIVKPARETPLIVARLARCLHQAGIPPQVLRVLPGDEPLEKQLINCCTGVLFFGQLETARALQARSPAQRVLTENTKLNYLFLDDSLALEQTMALALDGAFSCAGQNSSRLHVLCINQAFADEVIALLKAKLSELRFGDPLQPETDLGPLIDSRACIEMQTALTVLRDAGCEIWQAPQHLPQQGFFSLPALVELSSPALLSTPVSGPVLGIIAYRRHDLSRLCAQIKAHGICGNVHIHACDSRSRRTILEVLADHVDCNDSLKNHHASWSAANAAYLEKLLER